MIAAADPRRSGDWPGPGAVGLLPGRLPPGLIGMILLVGSIETMLERHAPGFTSDIAATWRWGGRSAARDAKDAEILCFGDSLVKFGVAPRVLEGRSSHKARNLAVLAGNPPSSYFLLRRALASGARPKALIIDAWIIHLNPITVPRLWPELASPVEAAALAWEGRDPGFFAAYLASWGFRSVRARAEIRARLLASLRGEESTTTACHDRNWRNWRQDQGATIIPPECTTADASVKYLDTPHVNDAPWACHPLNAVYLSKFLDLAKARDIPVFWLLPPNHPKYEKLYDRQDWDGRYRSFARALMDQYANLVVIDGRGAGYDATTLFDLVHMNRRGAYAFSEALGDILGERLGPGPGSRQRWVQIRPFSAADVAHVEDRMRTPRR